MRKPGACVGANSDDSGLKPKMSLLLFGVIIPGWTAQWSTNSQVMTEQFLDSHGRILKYNHGTILK